MELPLSFIILLLLKGASALEENYPSNNESHEDMSGASALKEDYPSNNESHELMSEPMGPKCKKGCSYQDVLNCLNLSKNNELFSMTRPVKDHSSVTDVKMELLLYAILDVKETEQKFVPYVWINMNWLNDYISWEPEDFCDIEHVTIPSDVLWKPDLTITEATEIDNVIQSSHLIIHYNGFVELRKEQLLVTTCKMKVYKFPFDIQMCTLTVKSLVHTGSEIKLRFTGDPGRVNAWSSELMEIEYEWLFINMSVKPVEDKIGDKTTLVYTIFMRRRAVLYIVNFLLPVLLFLALDLTTFLISDTGGEKLGFKVTVMLAITVMQLILHEFLPSSSNKIPLIAVYYIGIFALMMLSLLETIVVAYLLEKDSSPPWEDTDRDELMGEHCENKLSKINFYCWERGRKKLTQDASSNDALTDQSSMKSKKVGRLSSEPNGSERCDDETLKDLVETLTLLLNSQKEDSKPDYWRKVTKKINMIFFVFYSTASFLFLMIMYFLWNYTNE